MPTVLLGVHGPYVGYSTDPLMWPVTTSTTTLTVVGDGLESLDDSGYVETYSVPGSSYGTQPRFTAATDTLTLPANSVLSSIVPRVRGYKFGPYLDDNLKFVIDMYWPGPPGFLEWLSDFDRGNINALPDAYPDSYQTLTTEAGYPFITTGFSSSLAISFTNAGSDVRLSYAAVEVTYRLTSTPPLRQRQHTHDTLRQRQRSTDIRQRQRAR